MLHLGLDLSRKRLDVCALDERGERIAVTAALTQKAFATWSQDWPPMAVPFMRSSNR
jgi:hypothetical protein